LNLKSTNGSKADRGGQMTRFMINRHGKGKNNVTFVDGHSEAVELGMFWSLKWSKNFKVKNYMVQRNQTEDGGPIYQPE